MKKIDHLETKITSQDFSGKPKSYTEVDEIFFDGMENLNETLDPRSYKKSPTKLVNLDDNTTGPLPTPRPKRLKKASNYMISPNVQVFHLIITKT